MAHIEDKKGKKDKKDKLFVEMLPSANNYFPRAAVWFLAKSWASIETYSLNLIIRSFFNFIHPLIIPIIYSSSFPLFSVLSFIRQYSAESEISLMTSMYVCTYTCMISRGWGGARSTRKSPVNMLYSEMWVLGLRGYMNWYCGSIAL